MAGLDLVLDGTFAFDLSGAGNTVGDSWTIVDFDNLSTVNFGLSFSVLNFTDAGSDQWTKVENSALYTFNEVDGVLSVSVIPEPSTLLLVGIALGSVAFFRKRRR